jgi:hypothetical protein
VAQRRDHPVQGFDAGGRARLDDLIQFPNEIPHPSVRRIENPVLLPGEAATD